MTAATGWAVAGSPARRLAVIVLVHLNLNGFVSSPRLAASPAGRLAASPPRRLASPAGLPRCLAASPARHLAASPPRRIAGWPSRRLAASPARRLAPSPAGRLAAWARWEPLDGYGGVACRLDTSARRLSGGERRAAPREARASGRMTAWGSAELFRARVSRARNDSSRRGSRSARCAAVVHPSARLAEPRPSRGSSVRSVAAPG